MPAFYALASPMSCYISIYITLEQGVNCNEDEWSGLEAEYCTLVDICDNGSLPEVAAIAVHCFLPVYKMSDTDS